MPLSDLELNNGGTRKQFLHANLRNTRNVIGHSVTFGYFLRPNPEEIVPLVFRISKLKMRLFPKVHALKFDHIYGDETRLKRLFSLQAAEICYFLAMPRNIKQF